MFLITIPLFHTPKLSCISRLELWSYGGNEWMGILSGTRNHEENQSMWQAVDLALFIDAFLLNAQKKKWDLYPYEIWVTTQYCLSQFSDAHHIPWAIQTYHDQHSVGSKNP